jgi:Fructose-bisphosphate aldolase class-I
MAAASLNEIAQQLSAPGKGLLASDESTPTIGRPADTWSTKLIKIPSATKCGSSNELPLQDRKWQPSNTACDILRRLDRYNMLLAMLGKRLQKAGVENTEQNRRDYRQLFYTAPGIGSHISGERF